MTLGAVGEGGGEAANVAAWFDELIAGEVVGDLGGVADEAEGAVGHVLQNVLSHGEDLGGLGAVDGGEVSVVIEAVSCERGESTTGMLLTAVA